MEPVESQYLRDARASERVRCVHLPNGGSMNSHARGSLGVSLFLAVLSIVATTILAVPAFAASLEGEPGLSVDSATDSSPDADDPTASNAEFQASPIWRSVRIDEDGLIAQRGSASATYSPSLSSENPPGFYVPVRPEYEGRVLTIRATAFTSNDDLLSLSLGYNRHPIFDLEFGVWANPLWCSDFIDRCRPGVTTTAWGFFLQYGISRQLADQRGIRRRPWSFEVPFHLEFRYLNGDNISTVFWGVHIGIEFIRWFQPSVGLALKLTAGSPFVDMRTWNLQSLQLNFRGSIGITF